MQLFYDNNIANKETIVLNSIESAHAIKVLRLKKNDVLNITDGLGYLYKAQIIEPNYRKCLVKIISSEKMEPEKDYYLHVAIAPTKSMDRMEWFVEKSVEMGIDRITPIICKYSERKSIKNERLEKILISAMKQSLKYHKPIIDELLLFDNFIKNSNSEKKFIAYCNAKENFFNFEYEKESLFLIGPEGGFSESEVSSAIENNFKPIKISNSRLRTETAGVMISAALSIINQK